MPGRNGTGPIGQGPGKGRGRSRRRGQGGNRPGRARRAGAGATGFCVCPACGIRVAHQPGLPCAHMTCSLCGISLVRDSTA